MKTQSAKAKGRRLQKTVCKKISELTGEEWASSGKDKPIESRAMGQSGCDVRLETHVKNQFPFSIECKYQENWNVPQWIRQAKENEVDGTDWLLVARKNYFDPVVILDLRVLFRLMIKIPFWNERDYPLDAEIKNQDRWSVIDWIEVIRNNRNNNKWMLILERKDIEPVAIIDLEVFFEMLDKIKKEE